VNGVDSLERQFYARKFMIQKMILVVVLASGSLFLTNTSIHAEDLFRDRVAPILGHRCVNCHNSIDRKGDFSLQSRDDVLDSGFVEPGQPDDSELLQVLISHGGQKPTMPKSGEPLEATEVAAITDWIKAGAKWPDGFTIEDPVIEGSDWWSFAPMVKPDTGALMAASSPDATNPIDAFILKTLAEQKLTPSKPAEPRDLIRRLYFDLIGLPPTPEEVEAFMNESQREPAGTKPSAYERLVDRLLASEHHGERWARHWLDVVKYADTHGYDKDKLRPNAWPYRDYVIKSFNDDKPYSRFVQEQLEHFHFYCATYPELRKQFRQSLVVTVRIALDTGKSRRRGCRKSCGSTTSPRTSKKRFLAYPERSVVGTRFWNVKSGRSPRRTIGATNERCGPICSIALRKLCRPIKSDS
jgi:hypothetical protein